MDWCIFKGDWAFGGEKIFVGPYLGWGEGHGVNEFHPDSIKTHKFSTTSSIGIAAYYFYDFALFDDPLKFKLVSSYFYNRPNKLSGLSFSPEVTIMPHKLVALTVFYRLLTADLSKSEMSYSEFLPRQTVSTIGMKLALTIRMKN